MLVAIGCAGGARSAATAPVPHPDVIDGLFDVGAGSLHLNCIGRGAPTVLVDTGLGWSGAGWADIQRAVSGTTRTCVYDRAGVGYSSSPSLVPHTNRAMAGELHQLLVRAGVRGPFVLVGHSMGGMNLRLFASEHPEDVAGMVLVDAMTDEYDARYWSLIPKPAMDDLRERFRRVPEGVTYETLASGLAEMHDVSRSIGNRPLVVLTRGREDPFPAVPLELQPVMLLAWLEMQRELLRLSTNAVQVVAVNSHHNVHWEAPHLVAASIQETVQAVRAHRSVSVEPLMPFADERAP